MLLKKETQREAANMLRTKDEGLDLSGLAQSRSKKLIMHYKAF